MGYYSPNPYEAPEPPRCPDCDACMFENGHIGMRAGWECHNPECDACKPEYKVSECSLCGEEFPYGEYCPHCVGEFLK